MTTRKSRPARAAFAIKRINFSLSHQPPSARRRSTGEAVGCAEVARARVWSL